MIWPSHPCGTGPGPATREVTDVSERAEDQQPVDGLFADEHQEGFAARQAGPAPDGRTAGEDWDDAGPAATSPRRRVGRWVAAGAAAVLVLGLGGAGAYAWAKLSGGGDQPAAALPADTIGVVSLDLDPSAGQKIAAYRFLRRFPSAGVGTDPDRAVGDALSKVADDDPDSTNGLDVDRDLRPWLGSRAAVAVVPHRGSGSDSPDVVAVAAVTDEAKMRSSLEHLATTESGSFGFHYRDGWVVIAQRQSVADAVSADAARASLAESGTYRQDTGALPDGRIVTGWSDLGAAWRTVPAQDRKDLRDSLGGDVSGRYAFGLHMTDSSAQLSGRGFDLRLPGGSGEVGRAPAGAVLAALPADGTGAFAVSGLGDAARSVWDGLSDTDRADAREQVRTYGLSLPDDVVSALGSADAVWLGGGSDGNGLDVGVRIAGGDGTKPAVDRLLAAGRDAARDLAADDPYAGDVGDGSIASDGGGWLDPAELDGLTARSAGGGAVVAGPDTRTVDRLASPSARLGDRAGVDAVLPDLDSAGIAGWLDLDALVRQTSGLGGGDATAAAKRQSELAPLDQLGLVATNDGNQAFRMTLTLDPS